MACKIRGLMVTVCPSQFATRRTLFHVLVGCGLLMLKVSRLKLPVIWLLVSMWLNTLTKRDRKSGSAGMPRPISYAVFCLKKDSATTSHGAASVCLSTCSPPRFHYASSTWTYFYASVCGPGTDCASRAISLFIFVILLPDRC